MNRRPDTHPDGLEAARMLYAPPEPAPTPGLPPHVARELATALGFAAGFFRPDYPEDVDAAIARGEAARLGGHPTRTSEGELRTAYSKDAARRYGQGGAR